MNHAEESICNLLSGFADQMRAKADALNALVAQIRSNGVASVGGIKDICPSCGSTDVHACEWHCVACDSWLADITPSQEDE